MNKQVCLIAGATEGVGKITAMELAIRNKFDTTANRRDEERAS
jgi:NAD(P)-dependent dehydrogenase (short-subunit alcohol dehydrogenase family)